MSNSDFDFSITLAAIAFLNFGSTFFFSKKDLVFENIGNIFYILGSVFWFLD